MNVFKKRKHIWWQTPKMRTDENFDLERKASWLELFYDLMFVSIIAKLSLMLLGHLSVSGLGTFVFLFIPTWWIWNSITFYNERYEMNDIRHRLFTFLNMIPLAGIAFSIDGAMNDKAEAFAISYIVSRILIIYLWLTAGKSKIERKLSYIFTFGFSISVIIWLSSIFVPSPVRFILWGAGVLVDMITPMVSLRTQAKLPKISTSHIPERFGLLIILTIGETVVAAVNGLTSNPDLNLTTSVSCFLALCISFLIWWLYIDHVMYRIFKRNVWYILGWSYLHLPLAVAITAVSAGLAAIFQTLRQTVVPVYIHWLLCGSVASTLIIASLLGLMSENKDHHHKVIKFHMRNNNMLLLYKIIGASLALAVGFWGLNFNPISHLILLVIILSIPAVQGLYLWINSHLES